MNPQRLLRELCHSSASCSGTCKNSTKGQSSSAGCLLALPCRDSCPTQSTAHTLGWDTCLVVKRYLLRLSETREVVCHPNIHPYICLSLSPTMFHAHQKWRNKTGCEKEIEAEWQSGGPPGAGEGGFSDGVSPAAPTAQVTFSQGVNRWAGSLPDTGSRLGKRREYGKKEGGRMGTEVEGWSLAMQG